MPRKNSNWFERNRLSAFVCSAVIVAALIGGLTYPAWQPTRQRMLDWFQNKQATSPVAAKSIISSQPPDTLVLTPAAWKNIGLETAEVKLQDFSKVVSVPAIVVERPGRSTHDITAPMTGVVTQVYPVERQAVEPGMPLFDLRLTHEDIVTTQADFLANLQSLDVARQELKRLKGIREGVISGKRIIEQQYVVAKANSAVSANRQSLRLHGISAEQVARMERTREVLGNITVVAPDYPNSSEDGTVEHRYHVQSIQVNRGQNVTAGHLMAKLADHCLLYIEGKAFEDDAVQLLDASQSNATIQVFASSRESGSKEVLNLQLQSIANEIDQQSRVLKFYLLLPNELSDVTKSQSDQTQFISWKYRPGQRMDAKIPTAGTLKNKIVLPSAAVVIEGPNAFVFEQNGDNFDRVDVQVLFSDSQNVVLENDGQLVGSVIAVNGAYEMHLALKNQSGGAIDPHAGHTH